MIDKEKIKNHYNDVKITISEAERNSFADSYNNAEENAFAESIRNQLEQINDTFKKEIEELEQNSEWDRFCISFFGETNAGKSTIIESLRIIYNEETRLQRILENRQKINEALEANNKAYSSLVEQVKKLHELLNMKKRTVPLNIFIISIVLAALIPIILFAFVI